MLLFDTTSGSSRERNQITTITTTKWSTELSFVSKPAEIWAGCHNKKRKRKEKRVFIDLA